MTTLIPAGTLVKIKVSFIPDHEFNGKIGYVTNDDPYPDDKGLWYTVKLFNEDLSYGFLYEELEVIA